MTSNRLYKNNLEAKGVAVRRDSETTKKYKRGLSGKTLSQIDSEFWQYIFELLNSTSEYWQEEKNEIVEDITEYYYLKTGYQIKNSMLI